jgi:pimeloyl-ACP methyl ester carboxylesterase
MLLLPLLLPLLQVTVKVLKNCSHWVQQDYPGQVSDIMLDWLKQQQQQQQQQQQKTQQQ